MRLAARATRTAVRAVIASIAVLGIAVGARAAERAVDIPTRAGVSVRTLLLEPSSPNGAAVILLAGGTGRLELTPDGGIGQNRNNQLVRTRQDYADEGFVTLVPDVAADQKDGNAGVVGAYRWSAEHAQDIGAMVAWLRTRAAKVHLVGTSRAAMSVANAAVRLDGAQRPDSLVITSGMLMQVNGRAPSVEKSVGNLDRITQPVLLIYHKDDACNVSPPDKVAPFKALLTKAASVDVVMLSGGSTKGDPCEAASYHGYLGIDRDVVKTVSPWLKGH